MDLTMVFLLLLLCVAFLYASVGHGGASGYLALMAIFSMAPEVMKPTALLLNLFVSLVSFIQFYRGGHFSLKLFLPFAIASIPCSFVGGLIVVEGNLYKHILGLLLLILIIRFLFFKNLEADQLKPASVVASLLIGSAIGFLSGLIGIGGGILLSPVLLLLGWADQKRTAAISALFIFVNSLAGLAGQLVKGVQFSTDMYLYVVFAFVGGLGGAFLGSMRLPQQSLKNILALVLLLASYKLLFTQA
jgi:uncharacterized protein